MGSCCHRAQASGDAHRESPGSYRTRHWAARGPTWCSLRFGPRSCPRQPARAVGRCPSGSAALQAYRIARPGADAARPRGGTAHWSESPRRWTHGCQPATAAGHQRPRCGGSCADLVLRPYQPLFFQRGVVTMNSATRRLRLGPLRGSENVKITIVLPADLREALDRYAVVHSQVHGEHVDTAALTPHMLEAFIARDRGISKVAEKCKFSRHWRLACTSRTLLSLVLSDALSAPYAGSHKTSWLARAGSCPARWSTPAHATPPVRPA